MTRAKEIKVINKNSYYIHMNNRKSKSNVKITYLQGKPKTCLEKTVYKKQQGVPNICNR